MPSLPAPVTAPTPLAGLPSLAPALPDAGRRLALPPPAGTADALVIAQLADACAGGGRALAIVCADSLAAQRLTEELAAFAPARSIAFFPDWETLPYDPISPHQDLVSERLATLYRLSARARNEALVIFGGYDVDGVTSTALLLEVLRPLGWKVHYYLPHRMDEGYGLTQDGVEHCLGRFPVTFLLAVDCGSTAAGTIALLQQRGVDVIVLDHHQVSSAAPAATALVNPRLGLTGATPTPGTELCSAGLSFKLAHALLKRARETNLPGAAGFDLRPLLDLVALGTIADVVPLVHECCCFSSFTVMASSWRGHNHGLPLADAPTMGRGALAMIIPSVISSPIALRAELHIVRPPVGNSLARA